MTPNEPSHREPVTKNCRAEGADDAPVRLRRRNASERVRPVRALITRIRSHRIPRIVRAAGLVGVGALVGSGALWAGSLATQAEIRACVDARGYLFRASSCPGESLVWNQEGPAGPQGPAGPAGPQGPAGSQGPAGRTSKVANVADGLSAIALMIVRSQGNGKVYPSKGSTHEVVDYKTSCPARYRPIGAGFHGPISFALNASFPMADQRTWLLRFRYERGQPSTFMVMTVYCLRILPAPKS